jgi:hypothetical protein
LPQSEEVKETEFTTLQVRSQEYGKMPEEEKKEQ